MSASPGHQSQSHNGGFHRMQGMLDWYPHLRGASPLSVGPVLFFRLFEIPQALLSGIQPYYGEMLSMIFSWVHQTIIHLRWEKFAPGPVRFVEVNPDKNAGKARNASKLNTKGEKAEQEKG